MRTNRAEVIDVANHTGTKTALSSMNVPRSNHALAAAGSLVFAFGGYSQPNKGTAGIINCAVTSRTEVIDLANRTGTQTALPPMQVPRHCHASAAAGSRVFAIGVWNEQNERTSSCEFYDTRTDR